MSEQSKILEQMQDLVMSIIKTGSASEEQGKRIDKLEDLLHEQKCYQELKGSNYVYLGEEIAGLFFNQQKEKALDALYENEITPEDFFGFALYHLDEEPLVEMFTNAFIADVNKSYEEKLIKA